MLNIKDKLTQLSLNPNNCIVIGSGILNALDIRCSHDIDLVVDKETFSKLKDDKRFEIEKPLGLDILKYDVYEIGTGWNIQDINQFFSFDDLYSESIIIEGVRYINIDFLYKIKKILRNNLARKDKDDNDIHLIEEYYKTNKKRK